MTNVVTAPANALSVAKQQLAKLKADDSNQTFKGIYPLLDTPLIGEANPATVYLSQYQGTSKKTHTKRLSQISRYCGAPRNDYQWINWSIFTAPRIRAFITDLYEPEIVNGEYKQRAPNTLNGYLATLKGVMKIAFKAGLITHMQWTDIQDLKSLKNDASPAGRMASQQETQDLEKAVDDMRLRNPAKAARDRAIFRLAFFSGIRRHEFSHLDYSHLNLNEGTLIVLSKGGKRPTIELSQDVISALVEWLAFRGNGPGAIFTRVLITGDITDQRLSDEGIRYLFNSYSKVLGSERITCHDARRTFCSNVLDDDEIDPKTAMDLMRHSSFNTTALYDRRSGTKRRSVVDRLSKSILNGTPEDEK
ncbi:site-specific integrase [uncultured Amphritea sp.]|uniref:tyrosine-type recombinase/integrase n=1 Tax=uncultured Amphritea sp. TaxID=981605 RepID=UPI00260CBB07|nr:site-specific integrase [uncultured Amphritea sp.]